MGRQIGQPLAKFDADMSRATWALIQNPRGRQIGQPLACGQIRCSPVAGNLGTDSDIAAGEILNRRWESSTCHNFATLAT